MLNALLAQDALNATDRIAFAIKERANAFEQVDVVGTVEAPPAAALHRLDLAESGFPKSQHMLGNIELLSHLADRSKSFRRLIQHRLPQSLSPVESPSSIGKKVR